MGELGSEIFIVAADFAKLIAEETEKWEGGQVRTTFHTLRSAKSRVPGQSPPLMSAIARRGPSTMSLSLSGEAQNACSSVSSRNTRFIAGSAAVVARVSPLDSPQCFASIARWVELSEG